MTELDIHYQGLSGELVIDGKEFPQLEKVNCASNFQLTKLILLNLPKLKRVEAAQNRLTELVITNSPEIDFLYIHDNQFPIQNLSFLSKFNKIEYLSLGDNSFYGSLRPLASMEKLKNLFIEKTSLDNGIEYLPKSVKKIHCTGKIAEQLQDYKESLYGGRVISYNYRS